MDITCVDLRMQDAAYDSGISDHMAGRPMNSRHPAYWAMRRKLECAARMTLSTIEDAPAGRKETDR